MESPRIGVLLVNLGTPATPRPRDVRRYLREFLGDPFVIDLPAPLRVALLHGVILPLRTRRSAALYQSIWTPEGSPLLVHGRALRAALADALGSDYVVELAMRYGVPGIRGALQRLAAADVARVLVLPLFPQYSRATTGSVLARLDAEIARDPTLPPHEVLPPFYADDGFVAAWQAVASAPLADFRPDFVLMSYHGLPQRQVRAADRTRAHCLVRDDCCDAIAEVNRLCYRAHCFATTRALAASLALAPDGHATSFQSRFGPDAWLRPGTDELLPRLVADGHRRLAVLCPAFVADCLETLEEIGIRARERWRALGGEALLLVPSLNAHPRWVETLALWMRARA